MIGTTTACKYPVVIIECMFSLYCNWLSAKLKEAMALLSKAHGGLNERQYCGRCDEPIGSLQEDIHIWLRDTREARRKFKSYVNDESKKHDI